MGGPLKALFHSPHNNSMVGSIILQASQKGSTILPVMWLVQRGHWNVHPRNLPLEPTFSTTNLSASFPSGLGTLSWVHSHF